MRLWGTPGKRLLCFAWWRDINHRGPEGSCGRHLQKWLNDFYILIFMPLYALPSPCVWAGFSDLLLTNRTQHKWWAATLRLGYPYKTVILVLLSLSGLLCWSEQPCWKPPGGKELVNSTEELSPSDNHVSKLGACLSPQFGSEMSAALIYNLIAALWETLGQRNQLSYT